jgi:hypothetical protein
LNRCLSGSPRAEAVGSSAALMDVRYRRILFSNGSRAGGSSGFRRFRVPWFSACSFGT